MAFIRSVVPYMEGMRDAVKKRLYIQRLSELTGVEEYRFWDNLKDGRKETESATGQETRKRYRGEGRRHSDEQAGAS